MYFSKKIIFESGNESNFRIPSLISTSNGTLLAFCNDRKNTLADHADVMTVTMARKRIGCEWETPCEISGFGSWAYRIGSAVYDETSGKAMLFVQHLPVTKNEFKHYTDTELIELESRADTARRLAEPFGVREGWVILSSTDCGDTWSEAALKLSSGERDQYENEAFMLDCASTHGAAHGIVLRRGEHAGRILCPARTFTKEYDTWDDLRECGYNTAIYSDDQGESWRLSGCVQVATGEGTLIERADGSVLYNSRAYLKDGKRYLAVSQDGGVTFSDIGTDEFLREEIRIGCNASFIRVEREDIKDTSLLPDGADGVTLFCNPRADTRCNMSVCVSFDGGASWSRAKTVCDGPCAYSSLVFEPLTQRFHLIYERGKDAHEKNPYSAGICAAEFDLEWILSDK